MACQDIINKGKTLNVKLQEQKYTQFDKKHIEKLANKTTKLLEEYIQYYAEKVNDDPTSEKKLDIIFNNIFQEFKNIYGIDKMRDLIEEKRKINKKFYAISDLDTSMKYAKELLEEANRLKEKLQKKKSDRRFPDLFNELEILIQRIENARKSTKTQVVIESVTGVVTLGTAAVSGGLGIANSVLRGAAAPAAGAASAAASSGAKGAALAAPETVNIVANVGENLAPTIVNAGKATLKTGAGVLPAIAQASSGATRVMIASEIADRVGTGLSIGNFLVSRGVQSGVEEINEVSLDMCKLSSKIIAFVKKIKDIDKRSSSNYKSNLSATAIININHTSMLTKKQIKDLAGELFHEFTKDEFE